MRWHGVYEEGEEDNEYVQVRPEPRESLREDY